MQTPPSLWQSLRLVPRSYAVYTVALGFGDLGTGLARLAFPWLLFSLTHSAFVLGLASFAQMASTWIGPVLGVVTDRVDRRLLILLATVGSSLSWLAIAYLGMRGTAAGVVPLVPILALAFVQRTFDTLTMQASAVLRLVLTPVHARVGLSTWQFTVLNVSWYLSPALAGIVIGRFGAVAALWLTAFSGALVFVPALFLPAVPPAARPAAAAPNGGVARDMREGWQALRGEPILLWLSAFGFLYNGLWAGVSAIAVAFYRADLHMGAFVVGIVNLVAGSATTVVGTLTPLLRRHLPARHLLVLTFAVSGVGMAALAGSGGWAEASAGLALLEVPATPWLVLTSLFAQAKISRAVFGRVNALRTTLAMGGMPLFALVAGALAQAAGVRGGMLILGAFTLALGAAVPRTPLGRVEWPEPDATPTT